MCALFILFYICIVFCNYITHRTKKKVIPSQERLVSRSIISDYNRKVILQKSLKKPLKGSVGVLLCYTNHKQKSFILLGRERLGKHEEGTWCELGGSVEIGETFLEAAIREAKEESGGLYELQANHLLDNGQIYDNEYKQKDGCIRQEVYVLLKVNDYYSADVLCNAVSEQNKDTYKEKDDFKWVLYNGLCSVHTNPTILQDIDGHASTFRLRNFFYQALQRGVLPNEV